MKCKIDGCEKVVAYTGKMLCQMHYFRFMRYGTYELVGPRGRDGLPAVRKMRRSNPAGYQLLFDPSHPLSMKDGYVYEHRKVVYSIYKDELPNCQICGKPTHWATCHIDHIDADVTNNEPANLRPVCSGCNTFRAYPEQHTVKSCMAITFDGLTQTPEEWSRDARVEVTGRTITLRKRGGMSDFDALFSPKLTHNKTKKKRKK